MAAEDGLKAQKLLALGNVGKNEVALKGQKLSISKLLPFQGDFFVFVLKPRALPWARGFCPFRARGVRTGREALELLCLQPVLLSLEHFSQFQPSHFLLIKFILDFRQALAFLRQFLNR